MISLTPKTVAKAYLTVILVVATLISPLPYSLVTLILLIMQISSMYRQPRVGLSLALVICTLIFAPLALEPSAGRLFSTLLIIPAVYLLDQNLRDNAITQFSSSSKTGRKATTALKTLAIALMLLLASSAVLLNQTLMLTTIILISYIVAVFGYVSYRIPKVPIEESKTLKRVVVGDTVGNSAKLKSKADIPMYISLKKAFSWVHVEPSEFTLTAGGEAKVDLVITPPLAGPSSLQLQALTVDPWGLTQTSQTLEPVELHIIPRAKYAEWLAKKYLEQTAPGTAPAAATPPARSVKATRRGVEYQSSRPYQPGDRLKDVDWKHSYMLGELIVKEFAGAHGQPAIIVANLAAKDAEEADKLAYNFVMSALTLATEALPTALAVYNNREVLATTPPANPREALKKALELTRSITIVEPSERVLQSTEFRRLKRSIGQLEQVKTESALKLSEILQLEYQASQEAAKGHPASQALGKTVEGTPPPAVIAVVSSWSHDADALDLTIEKLREKGYNTVMVKVEQKKH